VLVGVALFIVVAVGIGMGVYVAAGVCVFVGVGVYAGVGDANSEDICVHPVSRLIRTSQIKF
jgi:hypothetical protein